MPQAKGPKPGETLEHYERRKLQSRESSAKSRFLKILRSPEWQNRRKDAVVTSPTKDKALRMAVTKKKSSLKAGRPPTVKPKSTISSKQTQNTIVSFHNLNKALTQAKSKGDTELVRKIEHQITETGGLKAYQAASIQGQSADRGGDTSIILVRWLQDLTKQNSPPKSQRPLMIDDSTSSTKPTLLEIGALSPKNACSLSPFFSGITRIDLHSQHPLIQQQDFMTMPLPTSTSSHFHTLSLSLVLNFVPTAAQRGAMLRRTTKFLHRPEQRQGGYLFLVLPAPCVTNSRYFNDERLALIMASLGYALLRRRQTAKLVYYLWQWRDEPMGAEKQKFGKVKVRDGAVMNNFCVVLEPE